MTRTHGVTLIDLLAGLAVSSVLALISIPSALNISRQLTLRAAGSEIATIFNQARARAVFHRAEVGVKWVSAGGDVVFAIHEDGNGNGVTSADIRSGVDRLVFGPLSMRKRFPGISFSIIAGLKVDPSGTPIGDILDAIRFGRSDICSFSPLGTSSPGSVYLSDGNARQAIVRVSPMTARIQVFEWLSPPGKWTLR
jgi:type II secretory pathway pseudopilin PulG